jgi:serine kinase of HPr protein (carbohydrate metabolism regulator)
LTPPVLHATALAEWRGGAWRAVLLRGPSGAGKSDFALRALAAGWRLVADDRVLAWASGGRLYARAPRRLSGLVEARGLGVVPVQHLAWAEIKLVVDLSEDPAAVERTPEPEWEQIAGVGVRRIALNGRESSATAKVSLALQAATLGAEPEPAYQAPLADEVKRPARRGGLKRNR